MRSELRKSDLILMKATGQECSQKVEPLQVEQRADELGRRRVLSEDRFKARNLVYLEHQQLSEQGLRLPHRFGQLGHHERGRRRVGSGLWLNCQEGDRQQIAIAE